MRPIVQTALRSLQGLAYAKVAVECSRTSTLWPRRVPPGWPGDRRSSVAEREREIARLRLAMTAEELVELKIARAMFLRMLLHSAPSRLQAWVDGDDLASMPMSHLFEWIAYDLERLELEELEATMEPCEVARYVTASIAFKGFE